MSTPDDKPPSSTDPSPATAPIPAPEPIVAQVQKPTPWPPVIEAPVMPAEPDRMELYLRGPTAFTA